MCGSCSNIRPIETSMAAGRTTMASGAMPKTTTRSSSWAGSCFDRRHLCGRLEKAHSVAFGIEKACIQTNARNIHRLPEHLPSRPSHLFQCFLNIRYCNDNRRMLTKWVLGVFVDTTIFCSRFFWFAFFAGPTPVHHNYHV